MTTHDTPPLDTLRAMYPVASGALTTDEMATASRLALAWLDGFADNRDALLGILQEMHAAHSLDTPVKRAAFALLLTMIEPNE